MSVPLLSTQTSSTSEGESADPSASPTHRSLPSAATWAPYWQLATPPTSRKPESSSPIRGNLLDPRSLDRPSLSGGANKLQEFHSGHGPDRPSLESTAAGTAASAEGAASAAR